MVPLPEHPDASAWSLRQSSICRPVVLSELTAELLLEPLVIPPDADRCTVYYGSGRSASDDSSFVHAVWFTPAVAVSSGLYHTEDEFRHYIEQLDQCLSSSAPTPQASSSVQPARGAYMELGTGGVVPGVGRPPSVFVGGAWHHRPISRHPRISDLVEPRLSRVLTVATMAAHAVLPVEEVQEAVRHMEHLEMDAPSLQQAYQYPSRLHGRPMVSSHQVALRRPRSEKSMTCQEAEEACQLATTDLHVDTCDGQGGWGLGAGTCYLCIPPPGVELPPAVSATALRSRDLAVFPPTRRPRGVRVGVMQPDWLCMLFTRTRSCPHGGVSPLDLDPVPSLLLPGLMCGRAVTYPLRMVDKLLRDCEHDTGASAMLCLSEKDHRLRTRMIANPCTVPHDASTRNHAV